MPFSITGFSPIVSRLTISNLTVWRGGENRPLTNTGSESTRRGIGTGALLTLFFKMMGCVHEARHIILKMVLCSVVLHPTCPLYISLPPGSCSSVFTAGCPPETVRADAFLSPPAGKLELIIPSPGPHLMPFYF